MKWPTAKLKYVAQLGYGDALSPGEATTISSGQFRAFGSNGPYGWSSTSNTNPPSIIIGRKGSYGKINWSPEACFASDTTFFIDSTRCNHDLRWLYWLLQTLELDKWTDEAAVPGLNREFVYSKIVAIPPHARQRAIADYLDRETARLDALVAAKERLLALLAEKRRAIVTRAVTRGLDPRVPTRDSGVPWLGEIPAHWGVKRLKFLLAGIDHGASPACFNVPASAGSVGVLRTGCVNGGVFREEENKALSHRSGGDFTTLVHAGDVLMSRASGSVNLIGSVALVEREPDARLLLSDKIFRLNVEPDLIDKRYLVYAAGIPSFRHQIMTVVSGAEGLANNITKSDVLDLWVVVPPLAEQRRIADDIERCTARMDRLRTMTRDTISLVIERRAALIAAAVTGRIDVGAAS